MIWAFTGKSCQTDFYRDDSFFVLNSLQDSIFKPNSLLQSLFQNICGMLFKEGKLSKFPPSAKEINYLSNLFSMPLALG